MSNITTKNVYVRGNRDIQHELVKLMCMLWAVSTNYWSECEPEDYMKLRTPHRPDVVLHATKPHPRRHSLVIIEVQRKVDRAWLKKMMSQYSGQCYILISLDKVPSDTVQAYSYVSNLLYSETSRHIPKATKSLKRAVKKPDAHNDYYITLDNGRRVLKKNEWKYKEV